MCTLSQPNTISPADRFYTQAICPACGEGVVYTTKDLYQAVKQDTPTSKKQENDVIDLSDDSDSDSDAYKPSAAGKPLFRARSRSRSVALKAPSESHAEDFLFLAPLLPLRRLNLQLSLPVVSRHRRKITV